MTDYLPSQQPIFYGQLPMAPQQRKDVYPPAADPSQLFYYHPYSYGLFLGGGNINASVGTGKKRPSTRQPRPVITIPPFGIGPVRDLNDNDVLSGRGGRINAHKGNVQFRELVMKHKKEYLAKTTKKLQKAHIAAALVQQIRGMNPPGRFLKEEKDGSWWDIGDQKAIKKVGQALREDGSTVREPSKDKDTKACNDSGTFKVCTKKTSSFITKDNNNATPVDGDKVAPNGVVTSSAAAKKAVTETEKSASKVTSPESTGNLGATKAQEEDPSASCDEVFGRLFHPSPPARVDAKREASMVSTMSGLSNISGLSNSILSSTGEMSASKGRSPASSGRQLQPLRQHWANRKQTTLDLTESEMMDMCQLLLSSSKGGRSESMMNLSAGMDNGACEPVTTMSFASEASGCSGVMSVTMISTFNSASDSLPSMSDLPEDLLTTLADLAENNM